MCARPFTPNHPLSLGRGEPKSGDLVAAVNIGTVAGPFTRAGTVIDDRIRNKRIGSAHGWWQIRTERSRVGRTSLAAKMEFECVTVPDL